MTDRFIYVSGPIKGYDDGNRSAFLNVSVALSGMGWSVVNPHEVEPGHSQGCRLGAVENGFEHSYECFMRYDIHALVDCHAIYMMKGWDKSVGAVAEWNVARVCGLHIFYEQPWPAMVGP